MKPIIWAAIAFAVGFGAGLGFGKGAAQRQEAGRAETSARSGGTHAPGLPPNHAPVHLTAEQQQLIGVTTTTVTLSPVSKEIYAVGTIAFDPELYNAQNDYLIALKEWRKLRKSRVAQARRSTKQVLDSARMRLRLLGLSDSQITLLEKGESRNSALVVHNPGGKAWVYAEIYEMDLPYVHAGMEAKVTASVLEGAELTGHVISVDRIVNEKTRSTTARILLDHTDPALLPQTYVKVKLVSDLGTQLSIPFYSVLDTGKEKWVFLDKGNGTYEPRLIQIKFRAGDRVVVKEGLKEGDKVVASANFLLDSESRLQATAHEASAPACPSGQHWDTSMSMCMPGGGR